MNEQDWKYVKPGDYLVLIKENPRKPLKQGDILKVLDRQGLTTCWCIILRTNELVCASLPANYEKLNLFQTILLETVPK